MAFRCALALAAPNPLEDLLGIGILSRDLPRMEEISIDDDLKDPSSGGDYHELRDLKLEFF
jgi:hypothetical protein